MPVSNLTFTPAFIVRVTPAFTVTVAVTVWSVDQVVSTVMGPDTATAVRTGPEGRLIIISNEANVNITTIDTLGRNLWEVGITTPADYMESGIIKVLVM
jgi:hypothetical protein